MTYNEALQKAAKLLRLSKSDNPNEAALAASRAQEIIDRYRIETEMLAYAVNGQEQPKDDEPIKDFSDDPLERLRRKSTWKARLAQHIANHNCCKMYNGWYGPTVIGRPSDVATVRYLYAWLVQEVDRLAERDCKGNGISWANNFRLGVVDTIGNRLHEQKKETEKAIRHETALLAAQQGLDQSVALIKVNNAIARTEQRRQQVDAWTKANVKLVSGRSSYSSYNPSARHAGQAAGREVRFTQAKGHIG